MVEFFASRVEKGVHGNYIVKSCDTPALTILNELDKRTPHKRIREQFLGLTRRDIHICRALAAVAIEERPEFKKNKNRRNSRARRRLEAGKISPPIKFLFDENISWRVVPELLNNISEISQIHLEDLQGSKDIELWNRFMTNGTRTIIVTNDDDFIRISQMHTLHRLMMLRSFKQAAQELHSIPFVVHIPSIYRETKKNLHMLSTQETIRCIKRNSSIFVKEALKKQQTQLHMSVGPDGIHRGPSLLHIFNECTLSAPALPDTIHRDYNRTLNPYESLYIDSQLRFKPHDLASLDFEEVMDFEKINIRRNMAEFPFARASDYPAPKVLENH